MTAHSGLRAFLAKRWVQFFLVVALLLALLPELLRIAAISLIARQGLGEIEIDDIDLNLFKGTAAIKHVRWQQPPVVVAVDRVDADIHWLPSLRESLRAGAFSLQTVASLQGLALDYQSLRLTGQQLQWRGRYGKGRAAGDLDIASARLIEATQNTVLLRWQSLALRRLQVAEANRVSAKSLQVEQLGAVQLAGQPRPEMQAAKLLLDNLSLQERQFSLGQCQLSRADLQLVMLPDGELLLQKILNTLLATFDQPSAEAEPAQPAQPLRFSLGRFAMTDNSQLSFVDQRFDQPLRQQLLIDRLELSDVNQGVPDQPATIDLSARLDEFSRLKLSGQLKPFAQALWLKLDGEINSLSLPAVSAYSERYLGYHLQRGLYNHQLQLMIEQGGLSLDNELLVKKLQMEKIAGDKPGALDQLDISLPLALNMLRDGEDNIKLTVPVSGRLDDPDVNINSVINLALGNALKKGATNYLKFMLQPYGAALMAAEIVGKQAARIRLDGINFVPGSAQLDDSALGYTEKLASLMQQRQQLNLTICSRSNLADHSLLQKTLAQQAVQPALQQLADERGKAVKQKLVELGVGSERLLLCKAMYQADSKAHIGLMM